MLSQLIAKSGISASVIAAAMVGFLGFGAASLATTTSVRADSCWWHNGSLMRLKARGNQRWFYYERPRSGLAVGRGTLLFNGRKQGNWYVGTARVFSKYCPSTPLPYHVEGPVAASQTEVTVFGTREIHRRCQPTGRYKEDRLVFTYSHRC